MLEGKCLILKLADKPRAPLDRNPIDSGVSIDQLAQNYSAEVFLLALWFSAVTIRLDSTVRPPFTLEEALGNPTENRGLLELAQRCGTQRLQASAIQLHLSNQEPRSEYSLSGAQGLTLLVWFPVWVTLYMWLGLKNQEPHSVDFLYRPQPPFLPT